jgi:hypothetical protein
MAVLVLGACDSKPVEPTDLSPLPDLTITNTAYTTVGALDDLSTVAFEVRVQNVGGSDSLGTSVSMYVDGDYVMDMALNGLRSQENATLRFDWPAEPGSHEIRFGVDQPPMDTPFVEESNENNNTATLALLVPFRERHVVEQDTMIFAALPSAVAGDSLVREVLALARDSGHTMPAGALTIRTRYDAEGVTSYITPIGPPHARADSVPILFVMTIPTVIHGVVTLPFLFQFVDSTTYVLYDARGGVRLFDAGDSIQVLGKVLAIGSTRPAMAAEPCSEPWVWTCVSAYITKNACIAGIGVTIYTGGVGAIFGSLAACVTFVNAFRACARSSTDDPPTIKTSILNNGPRCSECKGGVIIRWTYKGYRAEFSDDRGDVEEKTANTFVPTCSGGSFTFTAKDCKGQITSKTVSAIYDPLPNVLRSNPLGPLQYRSQQSVCHNQGGVSSLVLPTRPALLEWSEWRGCRLL